MTPINAHAQTPAAPDAETPRGTNRRLFLKLTAAGALALFAVDALGNQTQVGAVPLPGGSVDPTLVAKFVTPLLIPPVMPNSGTPNTYDIAVRQFSQQILPAGMPMTTVWGYGATNVPSSFHYPSYTIEATRGVPVTVTWRNELVDAAGNFLPHLLPVDPTLHWANPAGGVMGRDMRPTFTDTPAPYTGPVPMVPHVHGMGDVMDWSDGHTEAWWLPNAANIDPTYATVGSWYAYLQQRSGLSWAPGTATMVYPNVERNSTLWFHDHTIGMTRLNVYAGPAGFYLIRSAAIADNPTIKGGAAATLPSGAYEIPLVIQDRAFNADGSLFYPDSRAFFDAYAGPYVPHTDVPPIWNPEFFGNCMVVNGNTWPTLTVEPRRYRFRILNGCNSRFLILKLSRAVPMWQIGNEGGFLRTPVKQTQLLLAPAERADVILDFTGLKANTLVTLQNIGPDAPFGGGVVPAADPLTTGQVMQFKVGALARGARDLTQTPDKYILPAVPALPAVATRTRQVALTEMMSMDPTVGPIPVGALLGTWNSALPFPASMTKQMYGAPVTENPGLGDTEVWEIFNTTIDAHPIHLHEVLFQVLNRQPFDPLTGLPVGRRTTAPPAGESGYKDTVIAYPGQITRIKMQFNTAGRYMWHCHIVEHEDNEMMRPLQIGAPDPMQPMPMM